MRKCFLIVLFFLACSVTGLSQQNIDNLKRGLLVLRDSSRVDCMNELSIYYTQIEKKDSAWYYADMALTEAKKLNYVRGIAVSYTRKSRIVKHFDDDFNLEESLAKESLRWYEKTPDKKGIYDVYYELIYSLRSQSRFDEAVEYNQKAYEWCKENNDELHLAETLGSFPSIYKDAGNYEKSFEYSEQFHQLAIKANNKFWLSGSFFQLGELYMKIDDYPSALTYFRQAFQMDDADLVNARVAGDWDIWVKMEYAEIFSHLNQFDSAWYYFELFKPAKKEDRYFRVYLTSIGEYYFLQKMYNEALQNFLQGLYFHKELNDRNEIQRALMFVAQTYLALNKNDSALQYGREGLNLAFQTKAKQIIRDGYQVLYSVFDRQNQKDSANLYFRQYAVVNDTIATHQVKAKFISYGYQQKIQLLDKENQLQQQQLKQTSLQKKTLLAGIVIIFILGFILFRNILLKRKNEASTRRIVENDLQLQKLESKKVKAEFQQQTTELEMQALRAQMNPHFIFNCLSSINRFILVNKIEEASDYLTKFSRLIRMVLHNSEKPLIALESELEALRLYLDLERLRFKNAFNYSITFINTIDINAVYIPPMLIQPFAENAIWHGLMHKKSVGCLEIQLCAEGKALTCTIIDNGIGRNMAASFNSRSAEKNKPMGVEITAGRLALLNKSRAQAAVFNIVDLMDDEGNGCGTKVVLTIPYKELTEVIA